jgi:DNA-binding PucR family transcriptional regulator
MHSRAHLETVPSASRLLVRLRRRPRSSLVALGIVSDKREDLPVSLVHTSLARAELASRLRFTLLSFALREIKGLDAELGSCGHARMVPLASLEIADA